MLRHDNIPIAEAPASSVIGPAVEELSIDVEDETRPVKRTRRDGDVDTSARVLAQICDTLGVPNLEGLKTLLSVGAQVPVGKESTIIEEDEPDYLRRDRGCLIGGAGAYREARPMRPQGGSMTTATDRPVLAAFSHSVVKSKWVEPEHFGRLDSQTEDFDWWFYQMHTHLNDCGIMDEMDRMHFTRRYCVPDFRDNIIDRAIASGVDVEQLNLSLSAYRSFVTRMYDHPYSRQDLQRQLFALGMKTQTPAEAWSCVRRLTFCYDAKAKRAGALLLTEREKSDFFISALPVALRTYLFTMLQQDHPKVATAEKTYQMAEDYVRRSKFFGSPSAIEELSTPGDTSIFLLGKQTARENSADRFARKQPRRSQFKSKPPSKKKTAAPLALAQAELAINKDSAIAPFGKNDGAGPCSSQGDNSQPVRESSSQLPQQRRSEKFCTFCNMSGHTLAVCRRKQRSVAEVNPAPPQSKPLCSACNKRGHEESRCWIKFPHLKPAKFRSDQRNFAAVHTAMPGLADASLAPKMGADTSVHWEHSADPRTSASTILLTVPTERWDEERGVENVLASPSPHSNLGCNCLLQLVASLEGRAVKMIVDTGATVNLLHEKHINSLMTPTHVPPLPIKDVSGNTQLLDRKLSVTLEIDGYPYTFDFFVTSSIPADALLGIEAIREAGWLIDPIGRSLIHKTHALPPLHLAPCPHVAALAYAASGLYIPPRMWKPVPVSRPILAQPPPHALLCLTPTLPPSLPLHGAPTLVDATSKFPAALLLCNVSQEPLWIPAGSPIAYLDFCAVAASSSSTLSSSGGARETEVIASESEQQKLPGKVRVQQVFDLALAEALWPRKGFGSLKKLLWLWRDIWWQPEILGKTSKGIHKINTGEALPIAQPLRRLAWAERDIVRKEVDKMKEQNIIVESESPWSSPPVLVRKKDGSVRFCVDYRKLNDVTIADQYPLPRIDDVLDALSKGKYFAVIDLKSGYWQIPLEARDACKTAFRTLDGFYEFNVMPFGLKNAPATFQRLMDVVFSGLKWRGLLVYMDDIVVYSESIQEHLRLLEEVFKRLLEAGLKINPKKSTLVATEVRYLGHVVSALGIRPDPSKVKAVQNLKEPQTVRQVRMFLGLVGYYRKFIPAFATLAEPLSALTRKGQEFLWTPKCQQAFELLRERLCLAPILSYPRREWPCILDCDASDYAAGAVLMQKNASGQEEVVQYASCSFSEQERKWATMEKEAYAIVWAITTFRTYLLGRKFTVRTDNSAASTLKTARQPKLQRWAIILAEYDYEVEYRPGKKQTHVDALSRLPSRSQSKSQSPASLLPEAAAAFVLLRRRRGT